jgi:hypothetical protein
MYAWSEWEFWRFPNLFADRILGAAGRISEAIQSVVAPDTGNELSPSFPFNLMFSTQVRFADCYD